HLPDLQLSRARIYHDASASDHAERTPGGVGRSASRRLRSCHHTRKPRLRAARRRKSTHSSNHSRSSVAVWCSSAKALKTCCLSSSDAPTYASTAAAHSSGVTSHPSLDDSLYIARVPSWPDSHSSIASHARPSSSLDGRGCSPLMRASTSSCSSSYSSSLRSRHSLGWSGCRDR